MTSHDASATPIARRTLLTAGTLGVAAATLVSATVDTARAAAGPNPFAPGVALGDRRPDGFAIWTRLDTWPLNQDGFGGAPHQASHMQPSNRRRLRIRRATSPSSAPPRLDPRKCADSDARQGPIAKRNRPSEQFFG